MYHAILIPHARSGLGGLKCFEVSSRVRLANKKPFIWLPIPPMLPPSCSWGPAGGDNTNFDDED